MILNRFNKTKKGKELIITIDDINHIRYLEFLPTYISSIILFTQGLIDDKEKLRTFCKHRSLKADKPVEEIVSKSEESTTQDKTITEGEEIVFDDEEGDDDLFDLLVDSDDDDDEEEDGDEEDEEELEVKKEEKISSPDSVQSSQTTEPEELKDEVTGISLKNPNYFFAG